MASDPTLVERLGRVLLPHPGVEPRRMFGGTCFTLNGHMCIGVHNQNLILRLGPDRAEALMKRPHVKPMDLTGKVMKGWATVLPAGIRRDEDLAAYARLAVDFVKTLPPKKG